MRQRHPILLEALTSGGFLCIVWVHGYLVMHLGWPGFLIALGSGFGWGLLFTFGVPSWLPTDLHVLRGHSRDELFPSPQPRRTRRLPHRGVADSRT